MVDPGAAFCPRGADVLTTCSWSRRGRARSRPAVTPSIEGDRAGRDGSSGPASRDFRRSFRPLVLVIVKSEARGRRRQGARRTRRSGHPAAPTGLRLMRCSGPDVLFTRHETTDALRAVFRAGGRAGDVFYPDRWRHDKVVRSPHGVNGGWVGRRCCRREVVRRIVDERAAGSRLRVIAEGLSADGRAYCAGWRGVVDQQRAGSACRAGRGPTDRDPQPTGLNHTGDHREHRHPPEQVRARTSRRSDGTSTAPRAVQWAAAEASCAAPAADPACRSLRHPPAPDLGRQRADQILAHAYTVAIEPNPRCRSPRSPRRNSQCRRCAPRPLGPRCSWSEWAVQTAPRDVVIGSTAPADSRRPAARVIVVRGRRHPRGTNRPILVGVDNVMINAAALSFASADARRHDDPVVAISAI